MEELELECQKQSLIVKICDVYYDKVGIEKLVNFTGTTKDYPVIIKFMESKTIDELIDIVEKLSKQHKWAEKCNHNRIIDVINSINKINKIRNKTNKTEIEKDIAIIKDNVQNTTDVVNLFTDIDKNRTSTDDRIDKLEKEIYSLKESMNQILNLLQKN